MPRVASSVKERFWAKVRKDPSGCWIWTADKNQFGHGRFHYQGHTPAAHRVAWQLTYGDRSIPPEKCVLHSCHNPACVNPAHLKLGTQKENAQQRVKEGRSNPPRGEDHIGHKLNWDKVYKIRARYAKGGIGFAKLAKEYNVSPSTIISVIKYKTWTYEKN